MYEQLEQYEKAIEKYDKAIRICNQAIEKGMTTALILYHKMDLLSHLFQLHARNTPIDQIETYYDQSVQAATELTSLIPDPNIDYKIVRHRLQQGIDVMRSKGAQELADRWQAELSSKKLLP
jgi:tetratricopeptide (TPR) repeat protein